MNQHIGTVIVAPMTYRLACFYGQVACQRIFNQTSWLAVPPPVLPDSDLPCPAMTVEEPAIDFIPEKKAGNQPSEPVPVEKRRGSMEGLIGLT